MWYEWRGQDLKLQIVVQSRANSNNIVGVIGSYLKLRVTAPPVENKANQQVIKLLAKLFDVPKSRVHILSGATSRHKSVLIHSPRSLIDEIVQPNPRILSS